MSRLTIIPIIACLLTAFELHAQKTSLTPERAAEFESAGLTVILEKEDSVDKTVAKEQPATAGVAATEESTGANEQPAGERAGKAGEAVQQESGQTEQPVQLGQEAQEQAVSQPETILIALFPFDENAEPDHSAGFGAPVKFDRQTPAFWKDQEFGSHEPRLVEGKFGKGVLLEQSRSNLLTRNQSDVESGTDGFDPVNDAAITASKDERWQGSQSLRVVTPSNAGEEGFAVRVSVQKVVYNGNEIIPALYTASLYAKGQGYMQLLMREPGGDQVGSPLFFELSDEWQRFSCHYAFDFKPIKVGQNQQDSWQTNMPADTQLEAQLQLVCMTTDKQKAEFLADGLLLERRDLVDKGQGRTISPLEWLPGGANSAQELLSFQTDNDFFNEWKRNGTISFWFKPSWDARDGTRETIMRMDPGGSILDHAIACIRMPHVNVTLVPYEWKDQWHHIAITWNSASNHVLYVDGYEYPSARPLVNNAAVLSFFAGRYSPNGVVDEFALFQNALTPDQIREMAFEQRRAKP